MRFKQSLADFPLTVALGEKVPSWGLNRWAGQGLRFFPPDDEGFSLRGDKQRLLYKGRRRSHRFTILGDGAFEYDCILNREPESNVVSLLMDGAEDFDFYRQPDFVRDPFMKGSYAVYKKETLIGEGTGKLCHIHRPQIIDARGRHCWGELSIVGNCLCITIPENWLSEAAYPVIVDPTIGTTTVGKQTHYYNDDNDYLQLFLEVSIAVNRFLLPETLNGTATAYVYVYETDYDGQCKPVLYSDNSNVPLTRKSKSEGKFDIKVNNGNPAGWRSATFQTNTSITSGSYIWFGLFCDWFAVRFDYGAKCYWDFWDYLGNDIPNTYPVWSANWYYDFKLSTYFNYTSAQNYVRTLTQGVMLNDSRKLSADYKRSMLQAVNGIGVLNGCVSFFRQCVMNVTNSMSLFRNPTFIRSTFEQTGIIDGLKNSRGLNRKCEETTTVNDEVMRSQGFYRGVNDSLTFSDIAFYPVLFVRSISETQGISDTFRQWGEYIRGLYVEAGSLAATTHKAEYYRTESDMVQVDGSVFRGLLIFIRILTTSLVRDYFIKRFLKAKEELTLKSCITREISFESKIN